MPDSSDPEPPKTEDHAQPSAATELEIEEFHKIADQYLERLVAKLEAKQEETGEVDAEYSAGVLNIETHKNGTIVLNKQPPNRQIWWSSPASGPKRFDWVVSGESMHEKEGAGAGEWIYLKDGVTLNSLLKRELDVDLDLHSLEPEAGTVEKGAGV